METPVKKPTHAKPSLYAYYFLALKEIALEYGYNLVLHGSLNRDLDLIAIPWQEEVKDEFEMINALSKYLTGKISDYKTHYLYSELPAGRHSYVINLNRGGYQGKDDQYVDDPQYYIDVSVTPYTKGISLLVGKSNHYGE